MRSYHDDMETCVNIGGITKVENGVKQGDILQCWHCFLTSMVDELKDYCHGIYMQQANYSTSVDFLPKTYHYTDK